MTEKYQNKYRITSTRLQNWDYGWNAPYFITICTENRAHFFGEVVDGKMELSEIGILANDFLKEIPERYPYSKLDAFVVMPNHIHVIIVIDKNDDGRVDDGRVYCRGAINRASTINALQSASQSASQPGGITGNKNPMLNDNVSRIINWYKGRVTFESRKKKPNFAWQTRFYDHIIRNDKSFNNIHHYIINNPQKWTDDKFHKNEADDN